jgi:hypothetical protein
MNIDPEFPWAVDIPIPEFGNRDRVLLILDAASACAGGAMVTTFGEPEAAAVKRWFNRVSPKPRTTPTVWRAHSAQLARSG